MGVEMAGGGMDSMPRPTVRETFSDTPDQKHVASEVLHFKQLTVNENTLHIRVNIPHGACRTESYFYTSVFTPFSKVLHSNHW